MTEEEKRARPGLVTVDVGPERREALIREAGRRQAKQGRSVTLSELVCAAIDQYLRARRDRARP